MTANAIIAKDSKFPIKHEVSTYGNGVIRRDACILWSYETVELSNPAARRIQRGAGGWRKFYIVQNLS